MQKKIIVLAIAAALTAPALAMADATVYGQMNLSVDAINDGAVTNSGSSNNLDSNSSRVGVKGAEDVGGGMSVIWQMEAGFGADDGQNAGKATSTSTSTSTTTSSGTYASTAVYTTNTTTKTTTTGGQFFNRNTFVGLKSDSMGTLILGQNDTPYKTSTRRLDVFGDGIADNRGSQVAGGAFSGITMMGNGHDARVSNVIQYVSPSMSGFSVAVGSVFGAEGASGASKKGTAMSLAGMYEQGPIYATLAYDSNKYGDVGQLTAPTGFAADDESKAIKVGGSYSMDQFAVNAVIEKTTDTKVSVDTTGTNVYLAGKFNVSGTDAAKLAYTKRGTQTAGGTDLKNAASEVTVGYDHSMSKATTVYALYSKLTQDAANAADPSVISVGIKHSF